MTWESDGKCKEKFGLLVSKNDLRNLVDFISSSGKSEKLPFDVLL